MQPPGTLRAAYLILKDAPPKYAATNDPLGCALFQTSPSAMHGRQQLPKATYPTPSPLLQIVRYTLKAKAKQPEPNHHLDNQDWQEMPTYKDLHDRISNTANPKGPFSRFPPHDWI